MSRGRLFCFEMPLTGMLSATDEHVAVQQSE